MKISIAIDKRNNSVTITGTDTVDLKDHKSYKIKGEKPRWTAGVFDTPVTIRTGWVLERDAKHTSISRSFHSMLSAKRWANNAALALKEFYKDIE